MQIQTTLSFLLFKLVKVQNLDNSVSKYRETGTHTLVKMQKCTTFWRGFGKALYNLAFDPLLAIYSKDAFPKITTTRVCKIHCSIICNCKILKTI